MRETTSGWFFKVLWKDGSEQWIPLNVMKESNPLEVAKYATARGIEHEPAVLFFRSWADPGCNLYLDYKILYGSFRRWGLTPTSKPPNVEHSQQAP